MPAWISAIVGAVVNAVLPVVIAWIQKLIPRDSQHPALLACPVGGCPKAHYRATVRQWVVEFLTEMGSCLVKKGVIPTWLQPELPLIEALVASALDNALNAAGL